MATERKWTPAQGSAIGERSRTLLVSAAAGSGKTAVLTQRIISSLTDPEAPVDISRLLIVTFTRAAAGEMRKRISAALNKALAERPGDKRLLHQLMLLGSAKISTIDSFYLELVKANFEAAGFSPSFRMADDSELTSLRRDVMNGVIDRMYAEEAEFYRIADLLSDIRTESGLTEQLIGVAGSLSRYPESTELLLRAAEQQEMTAKDPFESLPGRVFYEAVRHLAEGGTEIAAHLLSLLPAEAEAEKLTKKYAPAYNDLKDHCEAVLAAIDRRDATGVAAALTAPLSVRVGGGKAPSQSPQLLHAAELGRSFRERWKSAAAEWGVFDDAEIKAGCTESAALLRLLYRALKAYEVDYRAAKAEREVAEFSDISRAAYRLLVEKDGTPTALAKSLSASYDAIYIDEYQDVDAMQDATFRAISTPRNRFMVGDIKQSIYRFRGADPSVFANYRKCFPALRDATDEDTAATVFMSDCFRCDESVIRFSNAVSGYLFSHSRESIGYTAADDLVFRKPVPETDPRPKCRVMILNKQDKTVAEALEESDKGEALMITAEIKRLMKDEVKADGTPIIPRDIAVLSRNTAFLAEMATLLKREGIPVSDTSRQRFFENPEVLCAFSLLSALDNPLRDVYMAAVLRSPFFGFSLEELVAVRGAADGAYSLFEALRAATESAPSPLREKCARTLARFERYREKAVELPVDKLLRYLYRDTALLSFAGEKERGKENEDGLLRQANLLRLYEYARKFEAGGFKGLYRFVRYVEDIMGNGTELQAPEGPENAVSLITIHHSKGLEYPVCFVANAAARMNKRDLTPTLLTDAELGCGVCLPNAGPFSRANTFVRAAIGEVLKNQGREEEMRVLYVAMTRARERLYVTGRPQYGADSVLQHAELQSSTATDFFAVDGSSYMEWVMAALLRDPQREAYCEISILSEEELFANARAVAEDEIVHDEAAPDEETQERWRRQFDFKYPYEHLTRLPAKLSVSRLSPEVLDVYDREEAVTPADLNAPDVERLLHTFEAAPRFADRAEREESAAARGTATHEFLQFADFARVERHGVENELARLVEARFLSPDAIGAVRKDELTRFFESAFYARLREAREVRRETRFHIFLPAAELTATESFRRELGEERLPVQGVIDLFFVDKDGRLILCDYKTDRLTPYELANPKAAAKVLFERHGQQLSYYRRAMSEICGREPDEILIYSLPLGMALSEA